MVQIRIYIQLLEWPSKSSHLSLIEHLWKDLKTAVRKWSPLNLTGLGQFSIDDRAKMSVSRCAKLMDTYYTRLAGSITVKGFFKKC